MADAPQFLATTLAEAMVEYDYNDPDDLASLGRFFARTLSPVATAAGAAATGDEPTIYVVPEPMIEAADPEGEFRRPGVTVRLVDTFPAESPSASSASYMLEHLVVVTAYGVDRVRTVRLAEAVRGAVHSEARYRLPMWAIDFDARLARKLRVLPESLSMAIEEQDDQAKWSRALEMRVRTPRSRGVSAVPLMRSVDSTYQPAS